VPKTGRDAIEALQRRLSGIGLMPAAKLSRPVYVVIREAVPFSKCLQLRLKSNTKIFPLYHSVAVLRVLSDGCDAPESRTVYELTLGINPKI
jgi:hypothetical protein